MTEKRSELKDWRDFFDSYTLDQAKHYVDRGEVYDFSCDSYKAQALVGKGSSKQPVFISGAPQKYTENWNLKKFSCGCQKYQRYYYNRRFEGCSHEAALLLAWEKKHGPWFFEESDEERRAREDEEKRRLEEERQREIEAKERQIKVMGADFLKSRYQGATGTYYDIIHGTEQSATNLYYQHRAEKLIENNAVVLEKKELEYDNSSEQLLKINAFVKCDCLSAPNRNVEMAFSRSKLCLYTCTCTYRYSYLDNFSPLCEHELAVLAKVYEYVKEYDPGDATDIAASAFFDAMESTGQSFGELEEKKAIVKSKNVTISPVLNFSDGSITLSFKIGVTGGKTFQLKNLELFALTYRGEGTFELGKNSAINFKEQEIEDSSTPWLNFVLQKVSDTNMINDRLEYRSRYSYYYTSSISVQNKDELYGTTLDRFYDIAEGTDCECTRKASEKKKPGRKLKSGIVIDGDTEEPANGRKGGASKTKEPSLVHIGHHNMKVSIRTSPITAANGKFLGILVTGTMPIIRSGSSDSYIIGEDYVSRISREENKALYPFSKTADLNGKISFQIGKDKLTEFYYRIVPAITSQPYIEFEDECAEEAVKIMPPEPKFRFAFDSEDDVFLCKETVDYEGEVTDLPRTGFKQDKYFDKVQEERAEKAVQKYFPYYDKDKKAYTVSATDDSLFRLLTDGVNELLKFGEVVGTDSFKLNRVKHIPQVRVGVSVESGIMDISVISSDISPKELLGILGSYKLKKKYYRLKSGEYVDLADGDDQLKSLTELSEKMNLPIDKLIEDGVQVPAFRALYLNKLLEERDNLIGDRNKTYRSLIKNFQTIRDADYDVPDDMKNILRPYQVYGFKWLRTLTAAGFGGILADEMGLGKTLQAIALMESVRSEENTYPDLVVCPASLVYNWQEEIARFSPKLKVAVVSGTAGARKKVLDEVGEKRTKASADILVTSYDSLRMDIHIYEKLQFNIIFLDEAQYIKNQKTGITKAVKILKGIHRFAMTGTPIENRLAELWSIFDFLMPGFLYKYNDFAGRFETAIAKNKDAEAAESLKSMVRPFILRRLKADVLKDLPDKLEEVRYVRFADEQRKVYDGQVVRLKKLISESGDNVEEKMKILAEITRLRQICCDPSLLFEDFKGESAKRKGCIDLINSAISGGHRMLVFSQFTSMLSLLEEDLKENGIEYFKIIGATPSKQRIQMVHEFNEGNVPVFLISLKAGGTGLNLTGADVVIHYDPWWNLAVQNQATDRAHRIGQKNTVTVYKMVIKDTIEEKIIALQEAKKDLADAILDGEGKSLFALTNEELLGLLK